MNCKNVEELLPLYVGRDLEESRTRLVTSHLLACRECARSAQEYGEANQLLQLFEPPQFSEATYTAVRSRVLREIERESQASQSISALEFIQRAFQPRFMWAVSTAVLLAVCLFAYYFIANRANGPQERADAAQPDRLIDSPAPSAQDPEPAITGTAGVPPALAAISHKPKLNKTVWHSQRAGGTAAVPVIAAHYSTAELNGTAPNTSLTSEQTLRLEIQTSDQNIRIIWFSHPSANEGSPKESSKGI